MAKRSKVSCRGLVRNTGGLGEGKRRTFRYGLPRFVTFIMWEEVAWGVVSGMAGGVDGLNVEWAGCEGRNGGGWRRETRMEGGGEGGGCGRRVGDS